MSRKRVVTGADARGRPIATWEDPDPERPGYAHMQPAFDVHAIERRQATPEELGPRELVLPAPKGGPAVLRMQQSRLNGAHRHVEVMAERRGDTSEEEPMIDPTDVAAGTEGPVLADDSPTANGTLRQLASAAAGAATAWEELREAAALHDAAAEVWRTARALLVATWELSDLVMSNGDVERHVAILEAALDEGLVPDADPLGLIAEADASVRLDGETQVVETSADPREIIPETIPTAAPLTAPRTIGPGSRATGDDGLTGRQRQVLEVVARHRGNLSAAARELRVTQQSVSAILKAAGKKKLLPADLIAILPAAFARYASVGA